MSSRIRVAMIPTRLDANPYLDALAAALPQERITEVRISWDDLAGAGATRRVDVVHLHWVQLILDADPEPDRRRAAARYLRRLLRLRQMGCRLVWTMHNLKSHEAPSRLLDRNVRRATASLADTVIVHCQAAQVQARRLWPVARCRVVAFPGSPREVAGRAAARELLRLPPDARVVVIPGQVRPYKDVAGAVRQLLAVGDERLRLIVVGRPLNRELGDQVREAAAGDRRVVLALGFQPEAELLSMVDAADVALLPYRRVLTSGAAMLCLESGVPVIAPDLGCLREEVGPAGALYPAGRLDAAARLAVGATAEVLDGWRAACRAQAERSSWAAVGRAHAEVYERAAR